MRHKYGVADKRDRIMDGIVFDSKREMQRYAELKLMERAGLIIALERQPIYVLQGPFRDSHGLKHRAITYRGDFSYVENNAIIVEDVKGVETHVFKLKRKMLLKLYPGIELRITK